MRIDGPGVDSALELFDKLFSELLVLVEDEIAMVECIVDDSSDIDALDIVYFVDDDVEHFCKDAS